MQASLHTMQVDKLKLSKDGKGAASVRKQDSQVADAQLLTKYQQSLAQFRKRKLTKGDRENATMSKLRKFKARMKEDGAHVASAARGVADAADGEAVNQAAPASDEQGQKPSAELAYDGKVNNNIDHRSYLPAAWRVRSPGTASWAVCSTQLLRHDMCTALVAEHTAPSLCFAAGACRQLEQQFLRPLFRPCCRWTRTPRMITLISHP